MTVVIQHSDIVPELTLVTSTSGSCQLYLADDPQIVADCVAIDPEGYLQVGSVDDCCRYRFQAYDGEVRQWLRLRDSLVTYASQPVICGHEEIVSADVASVVVWWSLGSD